MYLCNAVQKSERTITSQLFGLLIYNNQSSRAITCHGLKNKTECKKWINSEKDLKVKMNILTLCKCEYYSTE